MASLRDIGQSGTQGWITPIVTWALEIPNFYTRVFFDSRSEALRHPSTDVAYHVRRGCKVDIFVAAWLVVELLGLGGLILWPNPFIRGTACVLLGIRAIGIPAASLRVALDEDSRVLNRSRMVVLSCINYIELMICFAAFYTARAQDICGRKTDWLDGIHLSFISQLTIGYGDIYPTGCLRPIAWCQGLFALIVLGVAVARYVGGLHMIQAVSDKRGETDET